MSDDEQQLLDPETVTERVLFWGSWLSGGVAATGAMLMSMKSISIFPLWAFLGGSVLCLVLAFLRGALDERYVVDHPNRRLLFARTFSGKTSAKLVCTFGEVAAVAVTAKLYTPSQGPNYWIHGLALYLRDGSKVTVRSMARRGYSVVAGEGRALAEKMGAEFQAGGEDKVLIARPGKNGLEFRWRGSNFLLDNLMPDIAPYLVIALLCMLAIRWM